MREVRVLSFHAGYRCRQRGVCCGAGWPIPVERDRIGALEAAVAGRRLIPRTARLPPFERPADAPPDTPAILSRPDGLCMFFDADDPACRIHRALGHAALPLACRQFPRITVTDPRGAAVTLSHYCPTAAAGLMDEADVSIVTDAPAFPADGEYVGLDATNALPPLLQPDMAMDWESWWSLERRAVGLLGNGRDTLDADLATLRGVVERVRTWRLGQGTLASRIDDAFADAPRVGSLLTAEACLRTLSDTMPPEARGRQPAQPADRKQMAPGVVRRFLAAHAFASWTAYLSLDLRAWMQTIDIAHVLLTVGYRPADVDLLLRHLVDPSELARALSRPS